MILDKTIRNVVSTIRLFEKGFTSVQREPNELATRVGSVSEFVECRLNFEMRKMKEFSEFERCTGGRLMKVSGVTNEALFETFRVLDSKDKSSCKESFSHNVNL